MSDTPDTEVFIQEKSKKKKKGKNKRPVTGDETVAKKSKGKFLFFAMALNVLYG